MSIDNLCELWSRFPERLTLRRRVIPLRYRGDGKTPYMVLWKHGWVKTEEEGEEEWY